jgi:hypothetical protein
MWGMAKCTIIGSVLLPQTVNRLLPSSPPQEQRRQHSWPVVGIIFHLIPTPAILILSRAGKATTRL